MNKTKAVFKDLLWKNALIIANEKERLYVENVLKNCGGWRKVVYIFAYSYSIINITISNPFGPKPGSAVWAVMVMLYQRLHAERDKAAATTSTANISL